MREALIGLGLGVIVGATVVVLWLSEDIVRIVFGAPAKRVQRQMGL